MEQTLPSWHSKSIGCVPRELLISLLGSPVIVGELPWQHIVASSDLESGLLSFLQTQQPEPRLLGWMLGLPVDQWGRAGSLEVHPVFIGF